MRKKLLQVEVVRPKPWVGVGKQSLHRTHLRRSSPNFLCVLPTTLDEYYFYTSKNRKIVV